MPEPVGNSPRGGSSIPIPSNAHKDRIPDQPKVEERPPLPKAIVGDPITLKRPWYKRAARSMVADDATSVGDYILTGVVVPALKNLVSDIVTQGVNQALFGSPRARNTNSFNGGGGKIRQQYEHLSTVSSDPRPQLSRVAQNRYDFSIHPVPTRQEAEDVLGTLGDRLLEYKSTTVGDFYDLLGISSDYTARNYGWTNLSTARIIQTRQGFLFDMPEPVLLR